MIVRQRGHYCHFANLRQNTRLHPPNIAESLSIEETYKAIK